MDNSFKYVMENGGITTEDVYPYQGVKGDCQFKKETAAVQCKNFVDVPSKDEKALKEALATAGPVSVAIGKNAFYFLYFYPLKGGMSCIEGIFLFI